MFEKLYLIHNPLTNTQDWVSEREFTIGSQKLKNIFGVFYVEDVRSMLQFNIQFKEAVMRTYKLPTEKEISLHHVCRMISKAELMELIDREATVNAHSDSPFYPPYPSSIELKDGCFIWNKEKGCYDEAMNDPNALQEKY